MTINCVLIWAVGAADQLRYRRSFLNVLSAKIMAKINAKKTAKTQRNLRDRSLLASGPRRLVHCGP